LGGEEKGPVDGKKKTVKSSKIVGGKEAYESQTDEIKKPLETIRGKKGGKVQTVVKKGRPPGSAAFRGGKRKRGENPASKRGQSETKEAKGSRRKKQTNTVREPKKKKKKAKTER